MTRSVSFSSCLCCSVCPYVSSVHPTPSGGPVWVGGWVRIGGLGPTPKCTARIPDPPRTKRSYEFTDFCEQAFAAAYAAQACGETATAKRRDSQSGRVDAAGQSVRLLAHTSINYDRTLRSGEESALAMASDAAGKQARMSGTSAC